ncbi:MAG TPA: ankyrin repeat domain-containing protein, partial [Kofleriaceae bacterium]|nr:ankyrin repeat domain-containing protein [Kofleriaceae bacterium]
MTTKDHDGRDPLHDAALHNDVSEVEKLLKSGSNPNHPDNLGFTPLHFAAQENAVEAARLLVTNGADANFQNSYGNTPLGVAVFNYRGNGAMIEL